MKILVDADACPVTKTVVKIGKKYNKEVILFTDTSHIIDDDYATTVIVDKGPDSVDFALINKTKPYDIVVSQDYGVATMALSKKAFCINQNGLVYTDENIDNLLQKRYVSQQIRKAGGRTSGPPKRKKENDLQFEKSFIRLLEHALQLNKAHENK